MRILVAYRAIPQSPGWATGDCLVRAFRKLGHDAQPWAKLYQRDEWLEHPAWGPSMEPVCCCGKLEYASGGLLDVDLLVYLECNDDDEQYPHLLSLPCPRVYWEFDTTMHREWSRDWIESNYWTAVYMANPNELIGDAAYLPYAVDDTLFSHGNRERSGAACIGHPFPERVEFCQRADVELISGVYREDYVAALQGLQVSVHHHDSGGDGLLVARIWESIGAGACLLAPASESLYRHFTAGMHVATYESVEEARHLVHKLCERPEQTAATARRGYELVMREHTYVNRARTILEAL